VPQDGSLGQVYHLMAMAKLVLLKRHLGDLFPRPGSGDYFMWSSRWPLGYGHCYMCRVSCVPCV
jgi:hypothetical protein